MKQKAMLIIISWSAIVVLSGGTGSAQKTPGQDWTQLMQRDAPKHVANSRAPAAVAPAPNRSRSSGSTTSRMNPPHYTPEELAQMEALWRPPSMAARTADRLYDQGQYLQAAAILEGARNAIVPTRLGPRPDTELLLNRLGECYLRANRADLAFAVLAPYVATHVSDDFLLRASLAAARTGRAYAGQRAYLIDYLGCYHVPDSAQWFRQGNSPSVLEALSCLALACEEGGNTDKERYYASEALRLDPGNPIACEMLGSIEGGKPNCHYALAAQIYSQGIPRASGTILDMLKSKRDAAQYLHGLVGG